MTDAVHRASDVPAPGFPTLPMIGPLLVALPCLLAALLGFNSYSPYGADAALGIAVGAAAVVAMLAALRRPSRRRVALAGGGIALAVAFTLLLASRYLAAELGAALHTPVLPVSALPFSTPVSMSTSTVAAWTALA